MKKGLAALAFALFSPMAFFGYDWPQNETNTDSFYSYFGQNRGNTIENSLIFREPSEVKASEEGQVTITISDHSGEMGWFDSPLGNAVVIAHQDNISTVYGNLEEDSIPAEMAKPAKIQKGAFLGKSGNSGWQNGQSFLEFMVIDATSEALMNPRFLMPIIGQELPLTIEGVELIDKHGKKYRLASEKSVPSGFYYVYRKRQETAIPFKCITSVNGSKVEIMSYDALKEVEGKICVAGNSTYPVELVYPDSENHLMGTAHLSKGRAVLTLEVQDILGNSRTSSYTLEIR